MTTRECRCCKKEIFLTKGDSRNIYLDCYLKNGEYTEEALSKDE